MRRHHTTSLLLALGAVACADLTVPAAYVRTYHVVSANGAPLPTTVVSDVCTSTILGGWLDLSADAFSIVLVMNHRCTMLRDADTVTTWTDVALQLGGSVAVVGNALTLLERVQPPAASPVTPLRLRAIPGSKGLELTWLDGVYGVPAGTRLTLTHAPLPWSARGAPSPPN